jgi:predicted glycosyltransferase
MKKIGIAAYLNELAMRYGELARSASDMKARVALESLSVEISNKAHGLIDAFTIPENSRRLAAGND